MNSVFKIIILLLSLSNNYGYNLIHNLNSANTKSIIFCPGHLKFSLPHELYSNFLHKLGKKYTVYICEDNIKETTKLAGDLIDKNEELCVVSHSAGFKNALELSDEIDIKKMVIIDPLEFKVSKKNNDLGFNILNNFNFNLINTEEIDNKINDFLEADKLKLLRNNFFSKNINFDNVTNFNNNSDILIIKNKLGNRWRFIPPIPPINRLSIKNDDIKFDSKTVKELDYGHFDILDTPWANFLHKTISRGYYNRDNKIIEDYHQTLVDIINDFDKN